LPNGILTYSKDLEIDTYSRAYQAIEIIEYFLCFRLEYDPQTSDWETKNLEQFNNFVKESKMDVSIDTY